MTGMAKMQNLEHKSMDALLEENPPVIQWRLCPVRKVQVAWYVDDPHRDTGGANRLKDACKNGHRFDEENTNIKSDGSRECRTCKKAHNDARSKAA